MAKMSLFSERNNLILEPVFQFNSLDKRSRNMFYNIAEPVFFGNDIETNYDLHRKAAWNYFFHEINYSDYGFSNFYEKWFFETEWYSIFDLIEWLYKLLPRFGCIDQKTFSDLIKAVLIKNNIGFNFVNGQFIPITNQTEIDSIQETIENENATVELHFNKAVALFSDRVNPDYVNCIKESISAVEAMLRIVLKKDKGTLGELIKLLGDSSDFPTPFKEAWSKMYGYTSDNYGIRHAAREGERINIDFHHAKYFLIICSAFINYLKALK